MKLGILTTSKKGIRHPYVRRFYDEVAERGIEPQVIVAQQTVLSVRDYGRQLLQVVDKGKQYEEIVVDAVMPRLAGAIPAGLRALDVLASNNIPTTISSHAITLARDKLSTIVELDRRGIPVPYTVAPNGSVPKHPAGMLELIQTDKKLPLVVKTLLGSCGKGVNIEESQRSAKALVQTLGVKEVDFLVQEYIAPPDTQRASDVRIIVVGGKCVAAMRRTAGGDDEFRSNLSLGGTATVHEPTNRERELAIHSAEAIGAGVVGCDVMYSARGPVVTELNSNPGLNIERITGINVVGSIVDYAIRLAYENA